MKTDGVVRNGFLGALMLVAASGLWAVSHPTAALSRSGISSTRAGMASAATLYASRWASNHHVRMRFIAGRARAESDAATPLAGIELALDPGWKTYWRTPGEAGVPPFFDWGGSTNLEAAEVLYPAPNVYVDKYGSVIGYKHEVVFPVRVMARDPSLPVTLRLSMQYGICKDICVPIEARANIRLDPDSGAASPHAGHLQHYVDRVPRPMAAASDALPRITARTARLDGKSPYLLVEARFGIEARRHELFIEAPGGLFVALPEQSRTSKPGVVRFRSDLTKGEDPMLLKGKTLRLTLVSDEGAVETDWPIK